MTTANDDTPLVGFISDRPALALKSQMGVITVGDLLYLLNKTGPDSVTVRLLSYGCLPAQIEQAINSVRRTRTAVVTVPETPNSGQPAAESEGDAMAKGKGGGKPRRGGLDTVSEMVVPVKFNKVGFGNETATMSFIIEKKHVTRTQMDHYFIGAQCEVEIKRDAEAAEDVAGQRDFEGMKGHIFKSAGKFKSYSVHKDAYGCGSLQVALGELTDKDRAMLSRLSFSAGVMRLRRVGDIERAKKDAEGGEDDDAQLDLEDGVEKEKA